MKTELVLIWLGLLPVAESGVNKDQGLPKCPDETAFLQKGAQLANGAQRRAHQGFSLLQRWASPPHPGALELSSEELTRYITSGRLPTQVVSQLANSTTDGAPPASAEGRATKDEKDYIQKADNILGEMKTYEQKLEDVRLQAQTAYNKTVEQEDRLSDNFHNKSKLLDALIQKAADEASSAEVQTMQERLQRIHYKQIGALDRSAAYWLELAEKEKEARRVAEARGRLIEESEQLALEKQAQREEKSKQPKEEPYIEVMKPSSKVIHPALVPVDPGEIVPASTL